MSVMAAVASLRVAVERHVNRATGAAADTTHGTNQTPTREEEDEAGQGEGHVLRIEVPLPRSVGALAWLRGQQPSQQQQQTPQFPRVYFSPRRYATPGGEGSTDAELIGMRY